MVHHSQTGRLEDSLIWAPILCPNFLGHFSHRSYKVKLRAKGKLRPIRPHALVWEGKLGVRTGESQVLTATALAALSL